MKQDPRQADVAVVILNWNGKTHLETYLPSVVEHSKGKASIWVADNGSTDDSVSWLSSHYAQEVSVLELDKNHGFAGGYNLALESIVADTYVLLNSDVRVGEGWLDGVLEAMNKHSWDVCSPVVVQDVNPGQLEHAGAAGGWMDVDGFPFCVGRIFDAIEPLEDWHRIDREVFWASGACFFVRRSAWVSSGGFDASLFAHMEEIDLCWRIKNMGGRVGCAGNVTVRHLGGGTLPSESPFKTYLNFRNNLIVMLKNRDGFWPAFMFRRMLLDGIAAWRMLFSGKWRHFIAVGKAHGSLYLRLLRTLQERRNLNATAKENPNVVGWWNHSIVWAHFAERKRRVRDLKQWPS